MKELLHLESILLSFITLFLLSCTGKVTKEVEGEGIDMRYATLLHLMECDGYITAEISNPWDSTQVLHRYILVDKDKPLPENLPEGDVVRTPIQRAVVYTSVHSSLIEQLGAYDCIKGVCDLKYIKIPRLQNDCLKGKIKDLGESGNPNIEAIIDLDPDVIMLSPFQGSGTYGKLGKLGVSIIECADYMETSALGRAEWMRFYGLLTGTTAKADSIFRGIEQRYNDLKTKAQTATSKAPSVIVDFKYGNTWYVPGGQSTIGRLLADAGANYIFADTEQSGSIELPIETVFDKSINADIWLVRYNQATDKTYSEIATDYANYANMKAFKTHRIYGCNTKKTAFYEDTPFHPDLLLADLVSIFHPEITKGNKYYSLVTE